MVRRIPDHLAGFQRPDHPLKVFTVDHALVGAHPTPGLQPVDHRIIVRAIDTDAGSLHAEHPRADLKGQKMDANQQYARFLRLKLMHWLHSGAGHFGPARHAFVGPEPRHACLHQPHADGFKILHYHLVTLLLAHVRETEFQIASGNVGAA